METARYIPSTNEIQAFYHCGLCLKELPPDQSPEEYARLSFGATTLGFQVWCVRHEANVMHIDLDGRKVVANTSRATAPLPFGKPSVMYTDEDAERDGTHIRIGTTKAGLPIYMTRAVIEQGYDTPEKRQALVLRGIHLLDQPDPEDMQQFRMRVIEDDVLWVIADPVRLTFLMPAEY